MANEPQIIDVLTVVDTHSIMRKYEGQTTSASSPINVDEMLVFMVRSEEHTSELQSH